MSSDVRQPLGGLALAAAFGLTGVVLGDSELGGLLILAAVVAALVSLVRLALLLMRSGQ